MFLAGFLTKEKEVVCYLLFSKVYCQLSYLSSSEVRKMNSVLAQYGNRNGVREIKEGRSMSEGCGMVGAPHRNLPWVSA